MSTTIAAARKAWFDYARASADLRGVQVEFGPPLKDENQVVSLMEVLEDDEAEAAVGGGRKTETYLFAIGIKVFDQDLQPWEVEKRGFDLLDVVRDVVHGRARNNDRTLGGALGGSGIATMASFRTLGVRRVQGGGWVIFIRAVVRCQARIA